MQNLQSRDDEGHNSNMIHIIVGVVIGVGIALMIDFACCFYFTSDRSHRKKNKKVLEGILI
jgi:hypothetical protein